MKNKVNLSVFVGVQALACLLAGSLHAQFDTVKTNPATNALIHPTASQFKSANSIPSGTASTLTLNGSTSGTTTLTVPAVAGTYNFKLPPNAGTNGFVLQTDGTGVLTFVPQSGSTGNLTVGTTTISGGTDTRVLFNNGGFVGEYPISGTGSIVMSSRTVNGHALSANVTVTPTDLGLVIGTDVQAAGLILTTFNALSTVDAGFLYNDGSGGLSYAALGANWKTALAADLDANVAIWLNDPTAANLASAITVGSGTLFTSATSTNTIQASEHAADAGSTDAYAISTSPGISSYSLGARYRFKANTANSGAATLTIDSLPAKTIKRVGNGGLTADLVTGDILAGQWVDVVYDGNFQMQSTSGRSFLTSASAVTSLAGTANEITASAATGAVTLSLPTALTFTGKTVTGGTFASSTLTTPALGTPASGILTNCSGLPNSATTATSANTASTIVLRDGSGNFTAGTITAALTGNASTATALATGRTINGVSFDGTANISDYAADAGSNDTYVATLSPIPGSYGTGAHYRFKAATANTGAATINFNSLGAKTIKKAAGGITTDLADNDIRAGQWVDLVYDGTNMQMQSTMGNAGAGGTPGGSSGAVQYNNAGAFGGATGFTLSTGALTGLTTSGQLTLTGGVGDGTTFTTEVTSAGRTDFTINSTGSISVLIYALNGVASWVTYSDGSQFHFGHVGDGDTMIFDGAYVRALKPVSIGASSPAASTALDVQSTTQGFAPPRMTTTQKNAISSPAEGLMVYDTTLHKLCVYTGSAWETITSL